MCKVNLASLSLLSNFSYFVLSIVLCHRRASIQSIEHLTIPNISELGKKGVSRQLEWIIKEWKAGDAFKQMKLPAIFREDAEEMELPLESRSDKHKQRPDSSKLFGVGGKRMSMARAWPASGSLRKREHLEPKVWEEEIWVTSLLNAFI